MVLSDKQRKVHKYAWGLFGWAGVVEDAERLKRSIKRKQPLEGDLDLEAIMVEPNGDVYIFEGVIWVKQPPGYYALGSGSPYALGAMDAGADAVLAASIGAKRDMGSGGRILKVSL